MIGVGTTIFLVRPQTFASPVSYLLDTYSAAAAYSLRQLSSSTTNVVRVRRSSDNAESDFTADEITDGTLTTWTGANDGFVVRWYNQANANPYLYSAYNTVAGTQPKLVSSGSVITDGSEPTLRFDSTDLFDTNVAATTPWTTGGDTPSTINDLFTVAKINNYTSLNYVVGGAGAGTGFFYGGTYAGVNGLGGYDQANIRSNTGESLSQKLGYFHNDGANLEVAENGAALTDVGSFTFRPLRYIGYRSNFYFDGDISEVILFNTDESSNRTDIESDINTYYSIY